MRAVERNRPYVIVSTTGVVKLIDFGIAKASAAGMQTMSGTLKGKFAYMAPEYLAGQTSANSCCKRGVVARYHFLFFEPHPSPRALRCRQAGDIGQLLIGETAVILQRAQYFEVEGVHGDHAVKVLLMHKSCNL